MHELTVTCAICRIKKRTLSFLAQQGVDIEIIERAQKLDVTIADLPQIQRTKVSLQSLFKGPDDPFLAEVEEFARAETKSFTSQLGLRDIFLPTRDRGSFAFQFKPLACYLSFFFFSVCVQLCSDCRAYRGRSCPG
jgi:hypothetical protein